MSDISPALTAEEWASFPNWPDAEHVVLEPLYYPSLHGIAAANLHGQPFGFTREDVEVLTDAVGSVYSSMEGSAKLLSLADRIEALLPPEEKT